MSRRLLQEELSGFIKDISKMNIKPKIGLHCIIAITFFSFASAMELGQECIPCQILLNRMPPEAGICARTEDDCGVCLDGFQSEDLTAQRRSFKCFRRLDDGNGHVPEATSFINLSTNIWVVAISSLTLMTAITAIIVYIIKSHRNSRNATDGDKNGKRNVIALPPPYDTLDVPDSDVRTSVRNFTVGVTEEDQLNLATPLHRYYYGIPDEIREDDDVLAIDLPIPHDNAPIHPEGTLTDGSTETIPSTWEPTWADDIDESGGQLRLFRTQSMNDSFPSSPFISGYSNRIVHLSEFRNSNRSLEVRESHVSLPEESYCEDCEPEPPHSFILLDRENGSGDDHTVVINEPRLLTRSLSATDGRDHGSQDSGFFGFGSSRRRPAADDLEFGFAFFLKRSRRD